MPVKCKTCTVGMIGNLPVSEGMWHQAKEEFEKVVEDWNEKTKRFAIPHPGFAREFRFCPKCGANVEGVH